MSMSFRLPLQAAVVLTLGLSVVACGSTPTNPVNNTVSINNGDAAVSVVEGQTVQLTATTTPEGATVSYTSSDESIATVDQNGVVTGVAAGTATITATSGTVTDTITVNVQAAGTNPGPTPVNASFNFQPAKSTTPAGFTADTGAAYAAHGDAGSWGWVTEASAGTGNPTGLNLTGNTRDRAVKGISPEQNTFIHMQYTGTQTGNEKTAGAWEYAVPDGTYTVTVSVGDATGATNTPPYDSVNQINAERGTPNAKVLIDQFTASGNTAATLFKTATMDVTVNDGKLTIDANGGQNTKLDYIKIVTSANAAVPLNR